MPLINRLRCAIADGLCCIGPVLAGRFCCAAARLDRRPTTKPMPDDAPRTATATTPRPANAVVSPVIPLPPSPPPRRLLLPVVSDASLAANLSEEEPIWHWQTHSHRQVSPSSGALVVVATTVVDVATVVG
eukprot:CAMPEP_0115588318 /NCGR_PEP_ID=MMETSP0272-20121206/8654_1 /TAXON_ID=71861 /ORGANISM="Scrippsiella trochoidea, Strain CCMP3099" /LENGTH=130 /DNA_ID=CAMNT_0003023413 /DNA_START=446 /DNA_END=834 /DNA_ORIENTATION=+